MKVGSIAVGAIAGMVLAASAISVVYPDVVRRMRRDGKRLVKSGRKICGRMGG